MGQRCVSCGLFAVVLDPSPPYLPRLQCGDRVAQLWDASCDAACGRQPTSVLSAPITKVETPLRTALTDPLIDPRWTPHIHDILDSLERIREFQQTRNVATLNQAWGLLGPSAAAINKLLQQTQEQPQMQDDAHAAWQAGVGQALFESIYDSVSEFDNQDD
ncbi:MAG: hypothetical protein ACYCW6_28525 [Candidatus Xenobia bacterium]